ncbi:hypothetical protein [Streptomyces cyaneofuscatus]|uniref:hypothetical protein n=1 Tax=Streptomyces cyaneofuscatus TaxID=66883 RepID=UPI00342D14D0
MKAQARAGRAALAAMLAPVRTRIRLAMGLQIVGAAATVVPYITIAEPAKALPAPAPGPTNEGDVRRGRADPGVRALPLRALFGGVAPQASLRRRIVERLGRAPLGWFTADSSASVRKAAQSHLHGRGARGPPGGGDAVRRPLQRVDPAS